MNDPLVSAGFVLLALAILGAFVSAATPILFRLNRARFRPHKPPARSIEWPHWKGTP